MLFADSTQAAKIDKETIEQYKIPSVLLMENAGMRVADEAVATKADSFVVLCGKGNNGGDGSCAARHLICNGKKICIILLAEKSEITGDAKLMLDLAENFGAEIIEGFTEYAKECINKAEVIIDAIFGIGFKGNMKTEFADIISYVNFLNKKVIAIDVPSGVNASTGAVTDTAFKCIKTITFGIGRTGLMLYPAKEYAGEVKVCEISFSPNTFNELNTFETEYKSNENISADCHKGSVGKVILAAGSKGMSGAAFIASTAALKAGSGVVSLCIPDFLNDAAEQKLTEIMTIPITSNGTTMSADASEEILEQAEKYDVLVLGCGLGCNQDTVKLVNCLISSAHCDMVIDADGINCIDKEILKKHKNKIVITPHIGEMSRLTGMSADEIKVDLVNTAKNFAEEYNVAIVLKCATTVAAFPNGKAYINTIGNSGMATAGSGDALAGIIGAEIARGIDFETAVVNGVYLHSAAGDEAAGRLGKRYMSAMDIIDSLKFILKGRLTSDENMV